MTVKPQHPAIYLASKSPRRRELLRQIGVSHDVLLLRDLPPRGPDVSETIHAGEAPEIYVARVTHEKAAFGWNVLHMRKLPLRPVLAADTTVVLNQEILGKPANIDEAHTMLRQLSGKTHQVLTAVSVHYQEQAWQIIQKSDVRFSPLSDDTINAYCASREPYDKAGGYGIQGLAAVFIEHIAGSYSGIMGLPLHETAQLLRQVGVKTI